VGVADGVAELRPFAADITDSCHNSEILPGLLPKFNFTGRRRISPRAAADFWTGGDARRSTN
jgi:hypothetical protein